MNKENPLYNLIRNKIALILYALIGVGSSGVVTAIYKINAIDKKLEIGNRLHRADLYSRFPKAFIDSVIKEITTDELLHNIDHPDHN